MQVPMAPIRSEGAMLVSVAFGLSIVRSTVCLMCWQDLLEGGATLAEILRAGQWKSAAFLKYLDLEALEKGAVVVAHMDVSM